MKKLFLEIKTNRVRKLLLKNKVKSDNGVKVVFKNKKDYHGWIYLYITTNNKSLKIDISNVFPPFNSFVYFMFGVASDKLPNYWKIDEEGICKQFFLYAVDSKNLRLVIIDDCFKHENFTDKDLDKIVIDTIVSKKEFIKEFYLGFSKYVKNDFDIKKWQSSYPCDGDDLNYHLKILESIFGYWYHLDNFDTIHMWS